MTLRIDPELWEEFGDVIDDRSAVLRAFVEWYVRRPGARMPPRPTRSAEADQR